MIDQTASAVNAAKGILMGLDKANIETPVQTETLRWLLETLVDLGTRPAENKVADSAFRSVLGHTVAVQEAEKSRGW
jgi:hypothetical protein